MATKVTRCSTSWDVLHPTALKPSGTISREFLKLRLCDYREAAHYVSRLRYGRNANPSDPLAVLKEKRGTCSTKHVLMRRLAIEQKLDITLFLGIYEMTANNTPGIARVLEKHSLYCLPEAHCYLGSNGKKVDLTRAFDTGRSEQIKHFLHEEQIEPEQAGTYKRELHRRFLQRWIEENGLSATHGLEELWKIREECIAAIEASSCR